MGTKITHLMAVREAALLFDELADEIIDRRASAAGTGQTHVQFGFGREERGYTLEDLRDRVLRPNVTLMVAVISRDHKRICKTGMILKIRDGWSGSVVSLPNEIPLRLATIFEGDPDREITRLCALYGKVQQSELQ